MVQSISFQNGNAKLDGIVTFSIPSGHSCPGARVCLSKADRQTGHITDGPETTFRCFSASQEAGFPTVRRSRWNNFEALRAAKTRQGMVAVILAALPAAPLIRVHVAGDFFNQAYFDAWMDVARKRPESVFYAYTKSLAYWVQGEVPKNFRLVASRGGRLDFMIDAKGFPSATVVSHPDEARKLGLPIDHTDEYAWGADRQDFALLLHGTQPRGSVAAESVRRMKEEGIAFSYSRIKKPSSEQKRAA